MMEDSLLQTGYIDKSPGVNTPGRNNGTRTCPRISSPSLVGITVIVKQAVLLASGSSLPYTFPRHLSQWQSTVSTLILWMLAVDFPPGGVVVNRHTAGMPHSSALPGKKSPRHPPTDSGSTLYCRVALHYSGGTAPVFHRSSLLSPIWAPASNM